MMSANLSFSRLCKFSTIALALAAMAVSGTSTRAQEDRGPRTGTVEDWSTRHMIFSDPGTLGQAMAEGRFAQWYRTVSDPRYVMQQKRRNHGHDGPPADPWHRSEPGVKRDWAVSLGSGTVAQNQSPAKFSFNIGETVNAAACTNDFVVYGLNVAGTTGGQANLVALDNIYAGASPAGVCTGPTVFWAYHATSTAAGKITTSPTISNDATGSKIIYVESGGTTGPYLHVLVWNSSDGGTVAASKTPTNVLAVGTGVSSCPAGSPQPSCLVSILLNSGSATVTNSSPYYDYTGDTVYVGDDAGILYKVHPVLGSGTPAVTKLTVDSGAVLTGPTYDSNSGFVFVGDSSGVVSAVTASSFSSVAGSFQLGNNPCGSGNGTLTDAPIVDGTNGWVYEEVTDNASEVTGVEQLSTAGPFTTKNFVQTGQGDNGCNSSATFPTHGIEFDNAYYNGTVTSGHIYVCGRRTGGSGAAFWSIATSGLKGSINGVSGSENNGAGDGGTAVIRNTSHAECSPFTEIFNGSDYLFFGEGLGGSFTNVYGFTLSAGTATAISGSPLTTYPIANGGTSAIVVDNVSAANQASSIYFTTEAVSAGGSPCTTGTYCAIKLTQSALQ